MKNQFTLLLLLASFTLCLAQSEQEVGVNVGLMTYQGDLIKENIDLGESNFAFGVHYRTFVSKKFALKGGINIGKITGSDLSTPERVGRGITMENKLVELNLMAEWHPFAKPRFDEYGEFEPNLSPFVGFGLGMLFSNETITTQNSNLKPEEKAGSLAVLPFDLGLRYSFKQNLTLTLSGGTRATFSDLLDGVSYNGNSGADDWYLVGGLGIFYTW